ncbi:MAG: phytoene dehydrogenase [Candidatus Marinimicrobia bacterium]|nr:phytoene dehydrogenase [Candidatus Neomarinimicrobiota bacterium]|tara:strand:+ start:7596 stop:9065 length:1470 start_codon:yes stop_codon:yes gene_type:complete
MKKDIIVIGSGLAGMASAAYLAKEGHRVKVIEKNSTYGGRLQTYKEKGFTFDLGPSWYWMPDLFESFFSDFNRKASDYYTLTRLDPGYRVYFEDKEFFDVPESYEKLKKNLEKIESGSSDALDKFLADGKIKYEIAVKKFIYKPSLSPFEYIRLDLIKHLGRLAIFKPISKHIREFFTDKRIIQMLEFPGLLLGAKPSKTPALYSLMNYADIKLGTWYPSGGIRSVATAVQSVAVEQGVEFVYGEPIKKIHKKDKSVFEVISKNRSYDADIVIANADYEHVETNLLDKKYRNYSETYWNKRTMSPSALLFYIGLNKKINIPHHCLFFDTNFNSHVRDIYDDPKWPENPLFYVSCTSKTDVDVAPTGSEALFILIPVAPDLADEPALRDSYLEQVLDRIEQKTGESIRSNVVLTRSYAHKEFISDFNSFKGNAYGLANTLFQTAFLKPKIKNSRLSNLYYTGQLTVPGPGMPPALVSGKIVAKQVMKDNS